MIPNGWLDAGWVVPTDYSFCFRNEFTRQSRTQRYAHSLSCRLSPKLSGASFPRVDNSKTSLSSSLDQCLGEVTHIFHHVAQSAIPCRWDSAGAIEGLTTMTARGRVTALARLEVGVQPPRGQMNSFGCHRARGAARTRPVQCLMLTAMRHLLVLTLRLYHDGRSLW